MVALLLAVQVVLVQPLLSLVFLLFTLVAVAVVYLPLPIPHHRALLVQVERVAAQPVDTEQMEMPLQQIPAVAAAVLALLGLVQ
jgi:hypothetical protein